ncbi:tRNA preQ1(34) S-adenosylmethionine ribosyltransferase-isomerase QueA [Candidatus Methylomirabilis sp.]|uniref:tRNA preQ1(34) S-adenosylmethionine ribosyltransferase-isomerase QueA n=1 Tax=Candidatus Methylomirabilis sp. TaxID=2032687 RepID=UPI002A603E57|nr:tRNA preQ1(34) S-adenosylmethionine ribosyltransferase-isomerase QueA [Candidatus Methylomirabilis sp.]
MSIPLRTADFDYILPPDLIAQAPAPERDRSRLLVLDRSTGVLQDRIFRDIPEYLVPGDLLVINEAKVIPARLFGRSERRHRIEVLLLLEVETDCWEALVKPSRQIRVGDRLALADETITAEVIEKRGEGRHLLKLVYDGTLSDLLWQFGQMPVPPYIKRQPSLTPTPSTLDPSTLDRDRYQTVYAKHEGAIAAPTAGLHFTPELIETLTRQGVAVAPITLYVGPGTFRPVRVEEVSAHRMEPERYMIPEQTALAVKAARREGRRVIAVGTTTVRALEHAAVNGDVRSGAGVTDLFIYPGYRYTCIDALITNFHLPRSTLFMLVSAFAGRQAVLAAYHEAIALRYRFYSYGDAMLIV